MTVEVDDEGKKEEEHKALTREEKLQRFRGLAAVEPFFLIRFIEAIVEHLRISEEDQEKIWQEALDKWYRE